MGVLIKTVCRSLCIVLLLMATAWAEAPGNLAQQMLAETNLARTEPRRYAEYLRDMRQRFVGKGYRLPGSAMIIMTSEGVAALDEAIRYLSRQPPLPPLAWSPGLAEAAADLVRDQARSGRIGHDGSPSGGMQKRIERHGNWMGRIAENIGYGPDTARLMVTGLIIDDGIPGRGHRKNIFNRSFMVAGAACGAHPVYRNMCVMDFATQYKSRGKR